MSYLFYLRSMANGVNNVEGNFAKIKQIKVIGLKTKALTLVVITRK